MNQKRSKTLRRIVASGTLLLFAVTQQITPRDASAATPPSPAETVVKNFPQELASIRLPSRMGKIEETFKGSGAQTVVVIQDAHAIPDAQKSIQKIITHFQKKYGVSLVGLEGASSSLDPQIFRSFPDKKILRQVFGQYLNQGELTAGTGASIFDSAESVYHGVEDWKLYEQGIGLYLAAMKQEADLLEKQGRARRELGVKKEKNYSKELLEIDKKLEAFRLNQMDFTQTLKSLAMIQKPEKGSELTLFLEEIEKEEQDNTPVEMEVKRIAEQVRVSLDRGRGDEEQGRERLLFNEKYQEFQTSRLSSQAFALFLKELIVKDNLSIKVSRRLLGGMENQKKIRSMEGSKFFRDFERYAQSVKASLMQNETQKKLDAESHELDLTEKLIKLELSREEWEKLKERRGEKEKGRSDYKIHFAFYRNAELRDQAFLKNLNNLFVESPRHRVAPSALLVAGGFHAQGLTQRLKAQNISYLLVMPAIGSIPENTHYRDHMKGDVSWKNYFQVENGKINLYQAFVRGTRDKLLRSRPQSLVDDPRERQNQKGFNYGLAKHWRDQIIRDLAAKKQIERAGEYTKFIDEVAGSRGQGAGEFETKLKTAFEKVDRFIDGLRKLQSQNQLTEPNIANLLKTPTAVEAALSGALTPGAEIQTFNDLANAVTFEGEPQLLSRSEMRDFSMLDEKLPEPYEKGYEKLKKIADLLKAKDPEISQLPQELQERVHFLLLGLFTAGLVLNESENENAFSVLERFTDEIAVPLLSENDLMNTRLILESEAGRHIKKFITNVLQGDLLVYSETYLKSAIKRRDQWQNIRAFPLPMGIIVEQRGGTPFSSETKQKFKKALQTMIVSEWVDRNVESVFTRPMLAFSEQEVMNESMGAIARLILVINMQEAIEERSVFKRIQNKEENALEDISEIEWPFNGTTTSLSRALASLEQELVNDEFRLQLLLKSTKLLNFPENARQAEYDYLENELRLAKEASKAIRPHLDSAIPEASDWLKDLESRWENIRKTVALLRSEAREMEFKPGEKSFEIQGDFYFDIYQTGSKGIWSGGRLKGKTYFYHVSDPGHAIDPSLFAVSLPAFVTENGISFSSDDKTLKLVNNTGKSLQLLISDSLKSKAAPVPVEKEIKVTLGVVNSKFENGETRKFGIVTFDKVKIKIEDPKNSKQSWEISYIGGTANALTLFYGEMFGSLKHVNELSLGGVKISLNKSEHSLEITNESGEELKIISTAGVYQDEEKSDEPGFAVPKEKEIVLPKIPVKTNSIYEFELFTVPGHFFRVLIHPGNKLQVQMGQIYMSVLKEWNFDLNKQKVFKLGRHSDNDMVIEAFNVSRLHAQLTVIPSSDGEYQVILEDKSKNGTYVNGVRKEGPVALNINHIISVEEEGEISVAPKEKLQVVANPEAIPWSALSDPKNSQPIYLEYDLNSKQIVPTTYELKHASSEIPLPDSRLPQAEAEFDHFEDINDEILFLMGKQDMTLGDYQKLLSLMQEIVKVFQGLYGGKVSEVQFLEEAPKLLTYFMAAMQKELDKRKITATSEKLPLELVKMIGEAPGLRAQLLIQLPRINDYDLANHFRFTSAGIYQGLSLNEVLNVLHQKVVYNHDFLLESYGGKKRPITTTLFRPGGVSKSMQMSYVDTREQPNSTIPLAMEHVAVAFHKHILTSGHDKKFDPSIAHISANENHVRIGMRLGVHSSRVQYFLAPLGAGGRIVVNYQDSHYQNSPMRLKIISDLLKAEGFRIHLDMTSQRIHAVYDKESFSSGQLTDMPNKIQFVIQMLSAVKDWDISPYAPVLAEKFNEVFERMQQDGYVGPSWYENPTYLQPKISDQQEKEIDQLDKQFGALLGEVPHGQRDLDLLTEHLHKLIARGAVKVNSKEEIQSAVDYQQASKKSPLETFLEILTKADEEELQDMRRLAAVAQVAEKFGKMKLMGEVGGYQAYRLTVSLLGDDVTFYIFRDADTGAFRLAYAVLGNVFFDHPRFDSFRNRPLQNNKLSYGDVRELLQPQAMGKGQGLFSLLEGVGLKGQYSNQTIFEILENSPDFLDRTIPAFDKDTLKYGSKRGVISPMAVSGTIINRGKALGRMVLNHPGRAPEFFEESIFVSEEADVEDDEKMFKAIAIVVHKGNPNSHAAIQARQMGKPGIILDGVQYTPEGLSFDAPVKIPKTTSAPFMDGSASIASYGSDSGDLVSSSVPSSSIKKSLPLQKVSAQDGDVVYVDAASGMFYVIASTQDGDAQKSFDQYRLWKKTETHSAEDLGKILVSISNLNLFRAILDDIVTNDFLPVKDLQTLLLPMLSDPNKKEEVTHFFERKLRAARGAFMRHLKDFNAFVVAKQLDRVGLLLALARLNEEYKNIWIFLDLLEQRETSSISKEIQTLWDGILQTAHTVQERYREKLSNRISDFFKDKNNSNLISLIEKNQSQTLRPEEGSHVLTAINRFLENTSLANYSADETAKHPEISRLKELKKKVIAVRESQIRVMAGSRKVVTKDELLDIASRFVAGGKTSNSAQLRTALKVLRESLPENVRNPEGFAVLLGAYEGWKDQKNKTTLQDESVKQEIVRAYANLIETQRNALLKFLETDGSNQTFKEAVTKTLSLKNFGETVSAYDLDQSLRMIKAAIAGYFILTVQGGLLVTPELKSRLEVLGSVAVRSSGLLEDSRTNAQAGQKPTFLNVSETSRLFESILHIWESGTETVLVDEMTNPNKGGVVAFSVDATEKKSQILIISAFGQTKGIVDKDLPAVDTVILKSNLQSTKKYDLVDRKIRTKPIEILLDLENNGMKKADVALEKQSQPALTPEQELIVAQTIDLLAQYFGYPLDLEGAFWGDEFLIYQVRPITTLSEPIHEAQSLLRSEARKETEVIAEVVMGLSRSETQIAEAATLVQAESQKISMETFSDNLKQAVRELIDAEAKRKGLRVDPDKMKAMVDAIAAHVLPQIDGKVILGMVINSEMSVQEIKDYIEAMILSADALEGVVVSGDTKRVDFKELRENGIWVTTINNADNVRASMLPSQKIIPNLIQKDGEASKNSLVVKVGIEGEGDDPILKIGAAFMQVELALLMAATLTKADELKEKDKQEALIQAFFGKIPDYGVVTFRDGVPSINMPALQKYIQEFEAAQAVNAAA